MRILIPTAGSTGDVAPYTGLGARLRMAGHDVAIATFARFAEMVRAAGLEFRLLPGDPVATRRSDSTRRKRRGIHVIGLLSRWLEELGTAMISAAQQGTDLIMLTGLFMGGADIAEGLKIPSMGVFITPMHPTKNFPPPIGIPPLGPLGNKMAGQLALASSSIVLSAGVNRIRRQLGLPPRRISATIRLQDAARWPVFYGFSPAVVPPPSDWRPGVEVTGYYWPHVPAGWTPPQALADFLSDDPPPIFIGFGSMIPRNSDQLSQVLQEALHRCGLRAVIQAGWANLATRSPNILPIGEVPHEWLFPRTAAVVHHSGAGTTAAALRAGKPTVPIPMADDQTFWAARQAALGVCPTVLTMNKLTADKLADALTRAVSESTYQARAAEVAQRINSEDGAARVVDAVAKFAR